jgi:cysteine-rich repeat protein
VIEANTAKSSNIRILALGIGEVALGPGDGLRVENLKAISGHIVNGPTVLGSDVVTTDFPTMAAQLAAFASQTCGGTIFVNKYIDTVSNATRGGAGWAYSVTGPQSYSNNLGTDANGQGNTGTIPAGSGYAIVETNMLPGYSYGSANCKNQAGAPVGSSITNGVGSIALGDSDIISCDFVNTTNYVPVCGNSIVDPGEQCDLGNQNGLVCSPAYGQSCNYCGVSCQKVTVSGPYCGDGSINGTEQCDDGNVANGDGCSATCQVESGTLTVIKHVINDNGGTKSAGDFTITVTGGTPSSFSGSESGTTVTIPANGSYSVSETPIAGYANSYSADCTGTITAGGSKTCTITNDDIAPILHLRKIVINDNGNTVPATAWTLYATGPTSLSGTTPVDSNASFSAGTYLLSENGPTGYRTSAWVCVGGGSQSGSHGETLALGLGESATCTITNDDMSPRLRLRKVVINDNGGTATVSDFTLTADGAGSNDLSGTSPVDSDTLQPGTFTLSETNLPGYTASAWSCVGGTQNGSDITIQNNEEADCTITNDDIQPKLTITKSVIGGSAIVSDFNLFAGTTQFTSGIQAGINAGTHAITETGTQTANYTASFGGDCPQGSVTLNPGDVKSCTITNTRNTGTLYVHKLVDTDGNGTYDATDTGANSLGFLWGLDGVTPNRAMGSLPIVDTGTHNVNENSVTGYHFVGWYTDGDSCASPTGLTLPASVSVGMNSITTVTLCNARDNGSLKVNKLLDADGNGSFETSNPASFTWNVNGSGTNVMGSTVSVSPGSYSINENTVADYHTVGWYRNGGEGNCSNLDSSQLPASVDVFANTTTEITICNTRSTGTVTLDKVTNPSGDPTLFNLEIENSDQNGGHTPFGTYQVADSTTPVVVTVPTGWYGVDETALTGWVRGSTDCVRDDGGGQMYYNFYVGSGENVTCTYQNVRDTGTVVVHKDVQGPNGESVLDTSHTFQVSLDGAGTQNITDDGTVTYTNVPTGSHSVTESSIASDYNLYGISTSPDGSGHTGGLTVNVTNGTTDVYVTNRQQTAHITVIKRVFAPDGQTDVNDTNGQFTFDVSTQSAVLGDDASYTFDVNPGNYDVTEELNSEYVFAGCRAVYDNNSVGITVPNGENVTIGSGDTITVTCQNNQKPGTIIVTKYSDINGNGQVDTEDGDGVLSGWTMNITNGDDLHLSEQTGNDGTATFDTLSPDTYGLSENQQDGWRQTNIICDQEKISTEIADNILVPHVLAQDELSTDSTHTVPVDSNQTIHCSILNQPLTPIITITKTNDTGGADKAPGDSVLFTITVTLDETGGLANNVMVTDLPSQGFTYRTGSWTASSDVRGDLKSASITTEPTYASPGTWQLGNMTPGEHVTLTYLADISGDIQSGLYKDLAWAQGTDVLSNTVIANDTTGVFVGTEVSVLRTDKAGMSLNVIQESSVLGASTELPATGASSAWLILAGLLFVGGVGAVGTGMVFNRKPYKKSKRRLHA